MISVKKAKKKLFNSVKRLGLTEAKVIESLGCVLAKNIYSPIDLPPFDNSAMDGYAVKVGKSKSRKVKKFRIIGEMSAGMSDEMRVEEGEAVRINTGAMLPAGANAVVIKEDTLEKDGFVRVVRPDRFMKPVRFLNIRSKASDISKGELVLKRGTVITPEVIACLSAMGFSKVPVYRKPTVSLIVTGNELKSPGVNLKPGQIYDSNLPALRTLIRETGGELTYTARVQDSFEVTKKAFLKAAAVSDVIIFCGGISKGERDYVIRVLEEKKVKKIFHGVAQKPGKPLYAGLHRRKLIFGLPGNPAAAIICFYEYVHPALRRMMGYPKNGIELPQFMLPLQNSITFPKGKSAFLRGKRMEDGVKILAAQESHKLKSLAEADCIVYIPDGQRVKPGTNVEVQLLGQKSVF